MQRIFTARYLLPISAAPIEGGAILTRGDRILAVGPLQDLERQAAGAERIDFGEAVLLPPMVNAHTHLELTDFPEWASRADERPAEGASFVDWILQVIRVKRGQEASAFVPSVAHGLQQSLEAGTGALADILSYYPAGEAYLQTPLLGAFFYETLGRNPELTSRQLARTAKLFGGHMAPHLQTGVAPHSPYTLSAEYLEQVLDFTRHRGCLSSIHLAEPQAEVELLHDGSGELVDTLYPFVGWQDFLPQGTGLSPVAYLEACHGLRPDVLLVHGVKVGADDVALLKRYGCSMILCPRSNERLNVGRAPVELYRDAGVPLALGTDSLASNDSLSIWDELAAAARIYGAALTPDQLLQAATLNGARLLRLGAELGSLEAGRGAHFQVVDVPSGADLDNLSEALVTEGCRQTVRHLYLHGTSRLSN